jgi:hypothetical protein
VSVALLSSGCSKRGKAILVSLKNEIFRPRALDIIGSGRATNRMMFDYIRKYNTRIGSEKLMYIVDSYINESYREGVNHDIAFAQMCHETNFLKFGGDVYAVQNNFSGLETMNYDSYWACFFTIRDGIRAHVQHLKALSSKHSLSGKCIDPRFDVVTRGSAKTVRDLNAKLMPGYGKAVELKIEALLQM